MEMEAVAVGVPTTPGTLTMARPRQRINNKLKLPPLL